MFLCCHSANSGSKSPLPKSSPKSLLPPKWATEAGYLVLEAEHGGMLLYPSNGALPHKTFQPPIKDATGGIGFRAAALDVMLSLEARLAFEKRSVAVECACA